MSILSIHDAPGGKVSKQQHTDARLEGYQGPFFPPQVETLAETIGRYGNVNGALLEEAAEKMGGFVGKERARTSDGYAWFWALIFVTADDIVVVLLPWAQDWDGTDGTTADRSIAVHSGEGSQSAMTAVLDRFIEAFVDVADQRDARLAAYVAPPTPVDEVEATYPTRWTALRP